MFLHLIKEHHQPKSKAGYLYVCTSTFTLKVDEFIFVIHIPFTTVEAATTQLTQLNLGL